MHQPCSIAALAVLLCACAGQPGAMSSQDTVASGEARTIMVSYQPAQGGHRYLVRVLGSQRSTASGLERVAHAEAARVCPLGVAAGDMKRNNWTFAQEETAAAAATVNAPRAAYANGSASSRQVSDAPEVSLGFVCKH